MAVQITIIGLGRIGASIGLALSGHKDAIQITGNDRDSAIGQKAKKNGAIEKFVYNLPASVEKADVVILALPTAEIRPTLEIIARDLRPGCVVMDTAPFKAAVLAWVMELLPQDRHYVGLVPAISPACLLDSSAEGRADLFQKGTMGIVPAPGVPGEVIQLASDLTGLLGAAPLYIDAQEADGLMTAVHLLPQFLAAALVNATCERPGWLEARKLAGEPYATATLPAPEHSSSASAAAEAMANRDSLLRALTSCMLAIKELRDDVQEGNLSSLTTRLDQAADRRAAWLGERASVEWQQPDTGDRSYLTLGSQLKHLMIGERPKKK